MGSMSNVTVRTSAFRAVVEQAEGDMCPAPESALGQVSLLCIEAALCLLGKGRSGEEGLKTKVVDFFLFFFFF